MVGHRRGVCFLNEAHARAVHGGHGPPGLRAPLLAEHHARRHHTTDARLRPPCSCRRAWVCVGGWGSAACRANSAVRAGAGTALDLGRVQPRRLRQFLLVHERLPRELFLNKPAATPAALFLFIRHLLGVQRVILLPGQAGARQHVHAGRVASRPHTGQCLNACPHSVRATATTTIRASSASAFHALAGCVTGRAARIRGVAVSGVARVPRGKGRECWWGSLTVTVAARGQLPQCSAPHGVSRRRPHQVGLPPRR